jgi:RNA-directed DNA polymerase
MTVNELPGYLREHWPRIRAELLEDRYQPQPVRRVEIPKPGGRGVRVLGIPTVLDRFIQQALLQVLSPWFDGEFSPSSFGFRPGRSAHQAVRQAKSYIGEGYRWVVDIDIEKFFDHVHHDRLMAKLSQKIEDKRILHLIRRYLKVGIMMNRVVVERHQGTPQGGPLSPWLSNVVLDELDRELERRGHRFCRYADDSNIYVRSERAGCSTLGSMSCPL